MKAYDVIFDPMPPLDRLYFLTKTAQGIHLRKLCRIILFDDLESGVNGEIKLLEFVQHVQSGAWLLKPGSGPH